MISNQTLNSGGFNIKNYVTEESLSGIFLILVNIVALIQKPEHTSII